MHALRAVERELEHPHRGYARTVDELPAIGIYQPQILRDEQRGRIVGEHEVDEFLPRSVLPMPVDGGVAVPGGNGEVIVESTEMVQPQRVVHLQTMGYALAPPPVAALFHRGEIVKTVAPDLPLRGESVGRHSCHRARTAFFVQLKLRRIRPHVHAFRGDVEGKIADDLHSPRVHLFLQRVPLSVELVLLEHIIRDLVRQLFPRRGKRASVAEGKPALPLRPVAAVARGKRHKERVVVQPIAFLLRERVDLLTYLGVYTPESDA